MICTDVGGTTFDVGLIFNGELQLDAEPVLDQYAYALPKVLVKSIGAGGGSIGWIDAGGALRVGPRSAGSTPGPACYGKGGTEPTVTDADVVLGYLDPDNPLAGSLKLDAAAARTAIHSVAARLGVDDITLAAAMFSIANAQMADLIRKSTVEKGFDPRDFILLCYGGAGPVHAAFYAADTGVKATYIPAESSVFSAYGMLTTDMLFQAEMTLQLRTPLTAAQRARIEEVYQNLEAKVRESFARNQLDVASVTLTRSVDMRFAMQVHEIPVPGPRALMDEAGVAALLASFREKYEFTYGRNTAFGGAQVELMTFRVMGQAPVRRFTAPAAPLTARGAPPPHACKPAWFEGIGFVPTNRYRGDQLQPGHALSGPAIVDRMGDTIVIPPGVAGAVDGHGNVVLTSGGQR